MPDPTKPTAWLMIDPDERVNPADEEGEQKAKEPLIDTLPRSNNGAHKDQKNLLLAGHYHDSVSTLFRLNPEELMLLKESKKPEDEE